MISVEELNKYVEIYENKSFIENDPIKFPHKFSNKKDIEIAAFISSIFAYGKRELFIDVLSKLFDLMKNEPHNFVLSADKKIDTIKGIDYRFSKNIDIQQILLILNQLYKKDKSSLEELFKYGWDKTHTTVGMQQIVTDYFYARVDKEKVTQGFYHLIPNPQNKSPMKRMNLFLRWMIRGGEVDFALWNFMSKSNLLIPLDVHVAKISRDLHLLNGKTNNLQTVVELTNKLKEFDANDPIKYDFALFGYGITHSP